jgi:hypothetical protein
MRLPEIGWRELKGERKKRVSSAYLASKVERVK